MSEEKESCWQKAREKVYKSLEEIGIGASYVGLNGNGRVIAKVLNTSEIKQLLALYDHVNEIPKEYTIVFE